MACIVCGKDIDPILAEHNTGHPDCCDSCAIERRPEYQLIKLRQRVEHLSTKPIGVFGEEFSWEFHYKSLKDDLKRLVKSWDQYPREEA